jgi:nitrate reductase assembly molybdenum cofactor insertion protein NarJ
MNQKIVKLLRESAEWRLIALLLESPSRGWHEQVGRLTALVADPELKSAALAAAREATETLYHTTFGPGGPAAPREVSYQKGGLPGALLSEIAGYYDAFAYTPSLPEAPDHVAVEAGFVGYLRLKEAFALERGQAEQAQVAALAARHFLARHINRMAEPLAESLAQSGIRYLTLVSAALHTRAGSRREGPLDEEAPEAGCVAEGGCAFADEELP